ncbi:hypothetical protein LGR51_22250 [Pseudomonas sp. NP21570]|uniref:hypothetical protein n=1 Tax=Klebsiella quasipneumoniae TaxID=1463165 RepID=UPI001C8C3F34|nr:hypothetical protein [Klebsiella quasipneumoniae]MCB4797199.1 hypothetical protein [Pseudomonas sp. NP21570]MEB4704217.1 hypothetical protein [Klebsiella quasipneumoniae]
MFYYIKQAIATLRAIYWRRYLQGHGWYRMDARGNKEGVNAQFLPPKEHLAFPIQSKNERDLPEIWAEPLDIVIRSLESHKTYDQVLANLPDVDLIG